MQNPTPEARFLAAIARAAADQLGPAHPLSLAAAEAGSSPETAAPETAARVHELLALLEEDGRDRLLAAAHRSMREDIAAIWSFLPGAAQSGGMH